MTVELYDSRTRMVVDRTAVSMSGQFEFRSVPVGDYQVRLTDGRGNVVGQEFVNITGTLDHVSFQLPENRIQRPPDGTVSVHQLGRAKIPKPARKEFEKGVKAAEKSDSEGAIEHFRKAVEIAPDYMEAHNNLGARLLKAGQAKDAVPHLERAVELDPGSSMAFGNLAAAYMLTGRLPDAERAARQAERLDPTSARARLILGLALANLGQSDEALRYLATLRDELPHTRLTLAQVLADSGRQEDAIIELRAYLDLGDVPDRDKAEAWLARLEAPQPSARTPAASGVPEASGGVGQ